MLDLPRPALAGGLLWILACVGWFVFAARKASARSAPGSHGYPGRHPGLLLNGIGLVALTPVVSAVQYVASKHQLFWAGAGVFLVGLVQIAYHLLLARRPADRSPQPAVTRSSRPGAMTFRERSAVAQIIAILAVYGFYGVGLWDFWDRPLMSIAAIAALIGITVCMIIIGVVSHIGLVLYAPPEKLDERDRIIELRGSRNAYAALAAGVWCVLLLTIADLPHGLFFYATMAAFALAELVRLGSQLYYYRLGP
jgi:hypothetical protein